MAEERRRRIRLVLAYDGTGYSGWQVQPEHRTVQGVVQEALGRLQGGKAVPVRGAGRTDAGVHALGQVADGLVRERLSDREIERALCKILPPEIRPISVETVDTGFHSRRDARSKTYVYLLDRSPRGDPFRARFALHHPYEWDAGAVREALQRLPGRKDWSGFTGAAAPPGSRIRTLTEATLSEGPDDTAIFRFCADGFLNHMVRNLVGTLLEIGRGRFDPACVDRILESGDRTLAGPTAPPQGLCLYRVSYEGFPDPPLPSSLYDGPASRRR
jgi:tRNA pseudouridine38-40 synthase